MNDTAPSDPLSPHVREILNEAARADGTPPVSDQALLAVAQGRRELFEFDDAIGILGEGELDLVVRPASRGRGIGRRLLRSLLYGEDRRTPGELRAWAHGERPAAIALLRGAGFEPVRELLRLALDPADLGPAIDAARPLPDGFEVRGFGPGDSARADDWVRVNAAAFAAHPEQGSMTRADFDALISEPWFVAEDLRLASTTDAEQPGRLAGFTWIKTVRNGETARADESGEIGDTDETGDTVETELYVLGVDPAFAGRGLGAALLGETLRRMELQHPDRITLYVDGDNANALALYLRAGFTVEQRSRQYLRPAKGTDPHRSAN